MCVYVQKENKFHLLHKCINGCNSIRFNMYAQEGTARSFICCSGKRANWTARRVTWTAL